MKSPSRRSLLQERILFRLDQSPARTVTELAEAAGALRPSVSRSLKTLREDNLVERSRNGWTLTSAGREEAMRGYQELAGIADGLRLTLRAVAPLTGLPRELSTAGILGSFSVINDLHREHAAGILGSFSVINDLQREHAAGILGSFSVINDLQREFSVAFTQSISPLVDINRGMSMAAVQSIAIPDLGWLISRNNAMVARSIEDLHAVYSAPDVRANGFEKVLYPRVLGDLHDISGTYRGLFYESMKIADAKSDSIEMQDSWTRMLMPGSTVANFTRSLRSEVAPLPETDRGGMAQPPLHEQPKELLERLLKDLNPDLADRWHGSWQVLSDTNPDRISQAAFSYRELVRMVLDELAPGVEADPLVQASKRKKQVRHVLSGREGDFAVAMVEGLPRLYDFLSKSAHTSYRNEVAVQAALVAGDGLLLILLSSRQDYGT